MRSLRKIITSIASVAVALVALGLAVALPNGEAFAKTIDIDAADYGYGTYVVRAKGIGERGVFDEDTVVFYYVPLVATVVEDEKTGDYYVDLDYIADDGTEETAGNVKTITINVYDENDNLITSLSPIQVVAPTDKVILPMEEKDLPTGIYKVEAIAYNAEGEMIYQPFWTQFYYEKIEVPDTGSFFGQFNITKTDHLLTGLIIFVAVVAGGVLIIMKTSRPKVHVAAVRASRGRRNARVAKSSKTATRTRKATRVAKTTKTTKTRKR